MNWLYLQAKTKFKKQIALVFIMFGSVTYFWEASEILLKKRNYSKNTFLIENVSADHRELIQFIQKHKNHLLLVGALVIGYLAYKKFNK